VVRTARACPKVPQELISSILMSILMLTVAPPWLVWF
jgi:hypothetical protein